MCIENFKSFNIYGDKFCCIDTVPAESFTPFNAGTIMFTIVPYETAKKRR